MPRKRVDKEKQRKKNTRSDESFRQRVARAPRLAEQPKRIRLIGRAVRSGRRDRFVLQLDDARLLGVLLVFRADDILQRSKMKGAGGIQLVAIDIPLGAPVQVVETTTADRLTVGLIRQQIAFRGVQLARGGPLLQQEPTNVLADPIEPPLKGGEEGGATDILRDPIELTIGQAKESAGSPGPGTSVLDDPVELTVFQSKEGTRPSQDQPAPGGTEATDPLDDAAPPLPEPGQPAPPDDPTSPLRDPIELTFGQVKEVTGKQQDEIGPTTDLLLDPIELTISLKDWSLKMLDDMPLQPPPKENEPTDAVRDLPDLGPTGIVRDLPLPPKDPIQEYTMPEQDSPQEPKPDKPKQQGYWETTQSNLFTDDLTFLWIGGDIQIPF